MTGIPGRGKILAIGAALAASAAAGAFLWIALGPAVPTGPPVAASLTVVTSPSPEDPWQDVAPGWTELAAPPEVRSGATTAWTGRQLIVWGGYEYDGYSKEAPQGDGFVFDAESRSWSDLPKSPLSARSHAAGVWTGSEMLVWGGWDFGFDGSATFFGEGAAYDPVTGSWRTLPPAPVGPRAPLSVWSGEELIVWGTAVRSGGPLRDGAAYDPTADSWRRIADAPIDLTDATAVWSGEEMIVFGAALHGGNFPETETAIGAAYDPVADNWRRIPDSSLSPQASTAAWAGREMIAWDYLNGTAAYDPAEDEWHPLPRVPINDYECSPLSVPVNGYVFGGYCGRHIVLFDPAERAWREISPRDLFVGSVTRAAPVAADDVVVVMAWLLETDERRAFAFRPPLPEETRSPVPAQSSSAG